MTIDFDNVITTTAPNMGSLFAKCCNITELYIKNLKTTSVSSYYGMFSDCHNLRRLDMSCMRLGHIAHQANSMFWGCEHLEYIKISCQFEMMSMVDYQLQKAGIKVIPDF